MTPETPPVRVTSKIGEAPPETPPGVVYISADLEDDSPSRYARKTPPSTPKDS